MSLGSSIFKIRKKTPKNYKSRSGYFYKILILIGIIFIITYMIGYFYQDLGFTNKLLDSIIAFSVIFIGVGVIFYFLHCQFIKLANIADEIENDEGLKETE